MKAAPIFEVYEQQKGKRRYLYTKSIAPGYDVYGEKVFKEGSEEYREWDPSKSKLCAAILAGAANVFIRKNDWVLYLGSSTGTTVSHVSDMVGKKGLIFAVDSAPIVTRELVFLSEQRNNIAPILADAHHPESYEHRISQVDVLYQDVSQKDQVDIFLKNIQLFLKKGGYAILAVKARSIDVVKNPKEIYKKVYEQIEQQGLKIVDKRQLEPWQKDHLILFCKY